MYAFSCLFCAAHGTSLVPLLPVLQVFVTSIAGTAVCLPWCQLCNGSNLLCLSLEKRRLWLLISTLLIFAGHAVTRGTLAALPAM